MENLPPLPTRPDVPPPVITHISEMTEEQIQKIMCPRFLESYNRCKKEGLYCPKRDRIKEIQEAKEREQRAKEAEEKAKAERLAVLEARETVWVADARAKEKEFADYKAKTEERLNKMASLIQQLLPK